MTDGDGRTKFRHTTGTAGLERVANVLVGRVAGVHGLRGDCKVSADPRYLRPGMRLRARLAGRPEKSVAVESIRPGSPDLRIRFAGVADATAAAELRGAELYAEPMDLPTLAPNEFDVADLVGMRVVDGRLGDLGAVEDVAEYPHCDMLLVGKKRLLVPLLSAYGVRVDRNARRIETALPDGYEDLA